MRERMAELSPAILLHTTLFFIVFIIVLVGFIQHSIAGFVDPPPEVSASRPCVVFMSGGGSATDADRRARAGKFGPTVDVVIYKPNGLIYTLESLRPLQDFLTSKKSILGRNLHFLVSSAAGAPFETWIYDPRYLPSEIGGVIIAQPFSPSPKRPILSAAIKPSVYVVYDIRMDDACRELVNAGPAHFEDTTFTDKWYIRLGRRENFPLNIFQVFCQHSKAVGWSEDIALNVLMPLSRGDKATAVQTLNDQKRLNGLSFDGAPDPLGDCRNIESRPYALQVVAQAEASSSASSAIVHLGAGPSINDSGAVAYIARYHNNDQGILVGQRSGTTETRVPPGPFYAFGDMLQINNGNQIIFRQQSQDGLYADIYVLGPSGGEHQWVARNYFDRIDTQGIDRDSRFGQEPSDQGRTFSPGVTLDNSGRSMFAARLHDTSTQTVLATPKSTQTIDFVNDYYLFGPLSGSQDIFPSLADNLYAVVRWGTASTDPLLLFTNSTLNPALSIAGAPFFKAIGAKPGISDDGQLIMFMGDHGTLGGGIYGAARSRGFKVAGVAGDGKLDPGETWIDENENGVLDSGEDLGALINFSLIPRVSANKKQNDGVSQIYLAAFMATWANNNFGLFTAEVDLSSSPPKVSKAVPVVLVGDRLTRAEGPIGGIPGTVMDVSVYDPVNNSGELTFWVRTTETEAILRASRPSTFDVSVDYVRDGQIQISWPALAADSLVEYAETINGLFQTLDISPEVLGDRFVTKVPLTLTSGFFRLKAH